MWGRSSGSFQDARDARDATRKNLPDGQCAECLHYMEAAHRYKREADDVRRELGGYQEARAFMNACGVVVRHISEWMRSRS
jgi:hypothetical protein